MAKPRTYPKGKRVCIFCEGKSGARLSHEHIFPDWLRGIFRRSPNDTHTHGFMSWANDDFDAEPVIRKNTEQGIVPSRQVRVVCTKCNNEWMSGIEKRTRSLLTTLLWGRPITLGSDEQFVLATWIAKTVMAAEHIDRSKIAIPQSDRTLLMDTLAPPPNGWWIWIAGSQGLEWSAGINHFGAHAGFGPADPKTGNDLNVQSTTIGLGALLIFCVSTTWLHFQDFALSHPDRSDLKPIWPSTDNDIAWPPRRLLRDDEINVIATNLSRAKTFSGG